MKRLYYMSISIGTVLVLMAVISKEMRWGGTKEMSLAGLCVLLFAMLLYMYFLYLGYVRKVKENIGLRRLLFYLSLSISLSVGVVLILTSAVFKIMHWQEAKELNLTGVCLVLFAMLLFMYALLVKKKKTID